MLVLRARGVDAMVGKSMKNTIAASLVALVALGVPVTSSAQSRYYEDHYRRPYRCENRHDSRAPYAGPVVYDRYRARDSYYYERVHRRSKARTALMIAGSAATGAGIGGALRGSKGALIGAAIGGGAASIYESGRRR
jgi:hypothetical protein